MPNKVDLACNSGCNSGNVSADFDKDWLKIALATEFRQTGNGQHIDPEKMI
jgi:hypothetical protein